MDGDPSIGQASAPVTIAFWSDYQCPLCKAFELNTLPQMLKDYVDTGKVKIVFLDFAFLGNDSTTAALYGRSVWKLYPSRYLDWRTAMYTAQDQEGDKGFGNAVTIDTLDATIGGLDAAKIAADVKANTNTYQAAIDADRVEVTKAGITGTPSFVIGTQLIVGNQPYTILKAAIDPLVK
jgi:protein-disulfide isomerase